MTETGARLRDGGPPDEDDDALPLGFREGVGRGDDRGCATGSRAGVCECP